MFTPATDRFIKTVIKGDPKKIYASEGQHRLQVDAFVSRLAKIYEKIRNAIDYKEEHLLRKSAIFRILQRRLLIKISAEQLAEGLIKELIRAGYLENDLIPLSKVNQVQRIVDKYLVVFNLSGAKRNNGDGQKLFKWLLEICACEIEEALMPPVQQKAMVEYMYGAMVPQIQLVAKELTDKEKELHIYLATYRALVKSDVAMINFLLFKYYYPKWTVVNHTEIMEVAKKLRNLKKEIERHQKHPVAEKLLRIIKRYTLVFIVLRDIILENPNKAEEIFDNPKELEFQIRTTCDKLYKKARTKLRRSIVRVTIYIFITKMLLALLLEFPYDYYIAKEVFLLPLVINAVFPPLLMVFIGTFIRIPSRRNTNKVVSLALEIVTEGKISGVRGLAQTAKKSYFFRTIFYLLYLVLYTISFGVLISLLVNLRFNIFSIIIFLIFLSLISFFGIKLRYNIRDLVVADKKENPVMFLLNLFALPFLQAGHWMSVKFAKINIFVFIFDFIIEAPFKIFLEVIEDWLNFLKEKKEEIYNEQ